MAELAPGIDRNAGTQGGEPRVAGTRITIRRIGALADRGALTPADIAERFDITMGDVHRALAYYHDHPDEMVDDDEAERERERHADGAEPFAAARDRLASDP